MQCVARKCAFDSLLNRAHHTEEIGMGNNASNTSVPVQNREVADLNPNVTFRLGTGSDDLRTKGRGACAVAFANLRRPYNNHFHKRGGAKSFERLNDA